MKKIALTGVIGSGKSFVGEHIRSLGYEVLQADIMAKSVAADHLPEIAELLGQDVIAPDKTYDTKVAAKKVFERPELLTALNALLHPLVKKKRQQIFSERERAGAVAVFYESALIFESRIEDEFDSVIAVSASEEIRFERLKRLRGMFEEDIKKRQASQLDNDEKCRRADFIIRNDADAQEMRRETDNVLKKLGLLPYFL